MNDLTHILLKATTVEIIPTYKNKKSKVQHYATIFKNIPYISKDYQKLNSEIIFPDCTYSSAPSTLTIDNFQSYIINNPFSFEFHPEKGTTNLFTLTVKEN